MQGQGTTRPVPSPARWCWGFSTQAIGVDNFTWTVSKAMCPEQCHRQRASERRGPCRLSRAGPRPPAANKRTTTQQQNKTTNSTITDRPADCSCSTDMSGQMAALGGQPWLSLETFLCIAQHLIALAPRTAARLRPPRLNPGDIYGTYLASVTKPRVTTPAEASKGSKSSSPLA